MLLEEARDGHCSEHSGGQSQVGVDGCSVLPVPVVCDGRVEAGPEHPQEEGAYTESRVEIELKGPIRGSIVKVKKKKNHFIIKSHPPIIAKTSEW